MTETTVEQIKERIRGLADRIEPHHKERARGMLREMRESFTEHPKEAGEDYIAHLGFTTRTAGNLLFCGTVLLIHGLMPFLFKHTVSDRLDAMNAELRARAARVEEYTRNRQL